MQTIITEIENQIRNREENLRYQKQDAERNQLRLAEDQETVKRLKEELEVLKKR
jgi:hypothetical protein